MPPKPKPTSSAKELVPVGPRHISAARVGKGKRDANGEKPTTARALILRNGKHGARGTGELILMSRLTGREKLDLLAEDLVDKFKNAIGVPFSINQCLKIADSQCDVFLDDIANLRDSELFRHAIQSEMDARTVQNPKKPDPRRKPEYVAQMVGTRVHNSFMLASAWKIVKDTLHGLEIDGISDKNVKSKLKTEDHLRDRFLAAYEMVNLLVEMSRFRVSLLATATPHYAHFFKQKEAGNEAEYVFDWGTKLRDATLSFLDSIVLELCFPQETYPKYILYQLLRDAVEESPRESKRFTQTLWDAVGDLSVTVELQQILEAALLGPDGDEWKKGPRKMPKEFELWMDAQGYSETASSEVSNYKDIIYPLEKTRNKGILDNLWNCINLNYKAISGKNIDALWQLEGEWDFVPHWGAFYTINDDSDSDDGPSGLISRRKKHLAIADGPYNDEDSDDSMPPLQSVSNSSDGEDDYSDDSDKDNEGEGSDDEGYDTEQEDEIRDLLREAMDTAHEADWFDSSNAPAEIDPFLQEDRKRNPFLKLLGSLRGRMFSSNAKLRSAPKTQVPPATWTTQGRTKGPKVTIPKSQKATVEEVEDEDEAGAAPKKKKKKPKKKKKKSTAKEDETEKAGASAPPPVATPPPVAQPTPTAPASPAPKAKAKATPASKVAPKPVPQSSLSYPSVPVGTTQVQSGHSYATELLSKEKTKTKTRADHASIFSNNDDKKKGGFLSKLGFGKDKAKADNDAPARRSWLSRLTSKSKASMHQLLRTADDETQGLAGMKWDNFVKLMKELGFQYDPSTAGSSVRFDPPGKTDKSITIHKPHPDTTIHPVMLKVISKRLMRYYGWIEEDFLKQSGL